jgi:hypothetical protein
LIVARVRQQVRAGAHERDHMPEKPELNDKDLISTYVARVDVKPDHLAIRLATNSTRSPGKKSRQKLSTSMTSTISFGFSAISPVRKSIPPLTSC